MLDYVVEKSPREKSRPAQREPHIPYPKFLAKYSWLFVMAGIAGNILFFVGSISFLIPSAKTFAIWQFILGSCLMLISSSAAAADKYAANSGAK